MSIPYPGKRRWFLVITAFTLSLVGMGLLVLVLTGCQSANATSSNVISTPSPSHNRTSGQPVIPPGKTPPSWLAATPSFAGEVLHWTQTNYSYTPGGIDPANGHPVTADIWEQIGTDGIPTIFQARYTLADGAFLQAIVQTRDTMAVILGPIYNKFRPANGSSSGCSTEQRSSSTDAIHAVLPPFANKTGLTQSGFGKGNGDLTQRLPMTSSPAGVTPFLTYSSDGAVEQWVLPQAKNAGMTNTITLLVGPGDRVLVTQAKLTNTTAAIVSETWTAYGALQVYHSTTTLKSVFSTVQQLEGGCNA